MKIFEVFIYVHLTGHRSKWHSSNKWANKSSENKIITDMNACGMQSTGLHMHIFILTNISSWDTSMMCLLIYADSLPLPTKDHPYNSPCWLQAKKENTHTQTKSQHKCRSSMGQWKLEAVFFLAVDTSISRKLLSPLLENVTGMSIKGEVFNLAPHK